MRKISVFFLFLCMATGAYAQKNVIKWNAASIFAGNVSLNYERVIHNNWTLNLHGNYLIQRKLPNFVTERIWKNDEGQNRITIGQPRFSGIGFTPEVRYYFTGKNDKEAPSGLYAAAYLRMWSYTGKMGMNYKDGNGFDTDLNAEVRYYAVRPGLQWGYQWLIKRQFSLDAFFGVNYGLGGIRATVRGDLISDTYDVFMETLIQEGQLESPIVRKITGIIKDKITPYTDHVSFGTGFGWGWVRTGVTLGYAF